MSLPSPNSAAFLKRADQQIDFHTGSPQVAIPLGSISLSELSHSVSLSYNSSGIKVAEPASWVGLNWSLQAGGMVQRTILGLPDEADNGYFYVEDTLRNPNIQAGQMQKERVANGLLDSEPDMFTFSCGGYSGKFYISEGKARMIPRQDVKVSWTIDNSFDELTSFTIITPDGIRYIFGESEDENGNTVISREEHTYSGIGNSLYKPTVWQLLTIESYDRERQIHFSYEDERYSYYSLGSCSYDVIFGETGFNCSGNLPSGDGNAGTTLTRNKIEGKRLARIYTDTKEIVFNEGDDREDLNYYIPGVENTDGAKELGSIEIRQGTGDTYCKSYNFNYSYMQSPAIAHTTQATEEKRLILDSVQEISCDGTITIPAYYFQYESGIIANRLSRAVDHWGYFNGQTDNASTLGIPDVPGFPLPGKADRDSRESFMKRGQLSKITFPEGGEQIFAWEANQVNSLSINRVNSSTAEEFYLTKELYETGNISVDFTATSNNSQTLPCRNGESYLASIILMETSSSKEICAWQLDINQRSIDIDLSTCKDLQPNQKYRLSISTCGRAVDYKINDPTRVNSSGLAPVTVGGLRIATMTLYDGVDVANNIVKTYTYEDDNNNSYGKVYLEPRYSGQVLNPVNLTQTVGTRYTSTSYVPLANFNGTHMGYSQVIEHEGTANGSTQTLYSASFTGMPQQSVPYVPEDPRIFIGKMSSQNVRDNNNLTLQSVVHGVDDNLIDYENSANIMYKVTSFTTSNGTGIYGKTYDLSSTAYRVAELRETLDGVERITSYSYDATDHIQLTSEETTNSNGEVHRDDYFYFDTYPTTTEQDSLKDKNILKPWKTEHYVNNVQTDGIMKNYSFYDFFGNSSNQGNFFYPDTVYRYEMTYDVTETPLAGDWEYEFNHEQYDFDSGKPIRINYDGWKTSSGFQIDHTFTYTPTGRLLTDRFSSYEKVLTYYTDTDLVKTVTEIDDTETTYNYDALIRLDEVIGCNGDKLTVDYNYGLGDNMNYVSQTMTYPQFTNQPANHTIQNVVFHDGLGRSIQQLKVNQDPDDNGKSIATQTSYDEYGRVKEIHEPLVVSHTPGAYVSATGDSTFHLYEASPLDRLRAVKPPNWYFTRYTYGANETSEVEYIEGLTDYGAEELYKSSVIDPDNQITETFRDKRGNILLTRIRKDSSYVFTVMSDRDSIANTYTIYDPKDRPYQIFPPETGIGDTEKIFTKLYSGDDLLTYEDNPDEDRILHEYDDRKLLRFSQDGNMFAQNTWYAREYDIYGNIDLEGFVTNSGDDITTWLIDKNFGTSGSNTGKLTRDRRKVLNVAGNTMTLRNDYIYDACARNTRIEKNSVLHPDVGEIECTLVYDDANQLSSKIIDFTNDNITVERSNLYDHAGRHIQLDIAINHPDYQQNSTEVYQTSYTQKEQVKQLNLGQGLQKVDYSYSANRFLRTINSPYDGPWGVGDSSDDLFAMALGYDKNIDGSISNEAFRKNGDISATLWRHRYGTNSSSKAAYRYGYNFQNMLRGAKSFGALGNYSTAYSYEDKRGNLKTVNRRSQGQVIDNLSYDYQTDTNQLKSISDSAAAGQKNKGYVAATTNDYTQCDNGCIMYDAENGATITRDHLDLTTTIDIPDSSVVMVNHRDANGRLHRREITNDGELTTLDMIDELEFRNGELSTIHHEHGFITPIVAGVLNLTATHNHTVIEEATVINTDRILLTGNEENWGIDCVNLLNGFEVNQGAIYLADIRPSLLNFNYVIKDHLGSTRVVFNDRDQDGIIQDREVESALNYYPFGLAWIGDGGAFRQEEMIIDPLDSLGVQRQTVGVEENMRSVVSGGSIPKFRKSYTGQEQIPFSNYLEFDARTYLKAANVFDAPDPISDQFAHVNSYNYAANNPISNIDVGGLFPQSVNGEWPPKWWKRYRASADALKRWPTVMYGRESTFTEKAMAEVNAFTSSFGSYTSQNDVAVLGTGRNMDGSQASGFDKAIAGIFVAAPVSGSAVKNAGGALIEGTIKLFKNGDEVAESAFKFGNLGHAGSKPYREALNAIQGGGNFVAGTQDEALKLLDDALPGISNQTGKGQGRFGYRIDNGMSGNGLKNGHDGLHINYYDKDNGIKGTILIGQ